MKRLLIALSLFASPCMAEDVSDIANLYSTNVLQMGLTQISRPAQAAAQRSVLGEPLPAANYMVSRAELRYQAVEGISRTLRQQFANRVAASNPSQAYGIRRAFASDAIWLNFDRLLQTSGYSSLNLADVMASYYVRCWEVINATDAHPVFLRAVRNRLAWMLTYSPEVMLMSDIEKQRTAETLGIMTTVAQTGREELQRQNDPIGLALLQTAVYKSTLAQGIDFKQLTLTTRGFAPLKPAIIPPLNPQSAAPPPPVQQVVQQAVPAPAPQTPAQNTPASTQQAATQAYPAYLQYQAFLRTRAEAAQKN